MSYELKKTYLSEDEARSAIRDYLQNTRKSQSTVSKELGYSNATALNQFLGGTYPSPEKMIASIVQLLKISAKREVTTKKPPFQLTSTSLQVMNMIDLCHARGEMGVAYGDPGVGKTMAVRQYARENPDAIIITVSPTTANITGINELLADTLDIKEKGSRRITAGVIAKLRGATKRVIIVDEAQHLKAKVVNHLRSIVDATEDEDTGERIGMALIGNYEIYFELRVKQQPAYRQVADRITYWENLTSKDVELDDIRLIFKDVGFANDAMEILHKISTLVSVRKAIQVFTNTLDSAKNGMFEGEDIGAAQLAAIALKMGVDISRK
jgi:DNA transposition AAA+ family ATPase